MATPEYLLEETPMCISGREPSKQAINHSTNSSFAGKENKDSFEKFNEDMIKHLPSLDNAANFENQETSNFQQESNIGKKQSSAADAFVTNFSNLQIESVENTFKNVNIIYLQENPDRSIFNQGFQHDRNVYPDQYDNHQHVFFIGCQQVPITITEISTFDKCLIYVQTQVNKKILLIIPNALSEERLSKVKKCPQIYLIYQLDSQTYWIAKESDDDTKLLCSLLKQLKQLSDWISNDTNLLHPITEQDIKASLKDIDINSQTFIIYQLLIEIILRSKITENSRNDFMKYADEMFSKKGRFIKDIEEFNSSSRPERAIHWYTRPSFVYRILSYTCCSNNIHKIFRIRYFICSLYDELRKLHPESLSRFGDKLEVYRGKVMTNEEFIKLKNSIGNLVITRTFLSTTIDRNVALTYAGEDLPEGIVGVIFRMIIDTVTNRTKPFAYITSESRFNDEKEVLISIGTMFKIFSIVKVTEYVWQVTLQRDIEAETLEKTLLDQHLSANTENQAENINSMLDYLQNVHEEESCMDFIRRVCDRLQLFASTTTNENNETNRNEQSTLLTEVASTLSSTQQMTAQDNEMASSDTTTYPGNYDDTPNQMIIWLDQNIGRPDEYQHLKMAFSSAVDIRNDTPVKLIDEDYDELLRKEGPKPVSFEGVPFLLAAFTDVDHCIQCFEQNQHKRIYFITSGSMGRTAVPIILNRFSKTFTDPVTNEPYISIYVFCTNIEHQMDWALDYVDYIQIFNFDADLLVRMIRDIANYYVIESQRLLFNDSSNKSAVYQCLSWAHELYRRYAERENVSMKNELNEVNKLLGLAKD